MAASTSTIVSRNWLRMPVPDKNPNDEFFNFTGIAIFDDLEGTGKETVTIFADYSNIIPAGKAIRTRFWTVNVHLASIFNANHAVNTRWAVNGWFLEKSENKLGGPTVAAPNGILRIRSDIDIGDKDAIISRLSYDVAIYGRIVDWESNIPPID